MSILSKIKNLITICRNDVYQAGKWKVSFLGSQAPTQIPQIQNYGFKSRAVTGKKCVMISRDGNPNAGIIIAIEDDTGAPGLDEGEVAVYNLAGATITLKSSGNIELDGGDVLIKGGNLEIEAGDATASGDVSDSNLTTPSMSAMRDLFNAHIHTISGSVTTIPTTQQ